MRPILLLGIIMLTATPVQAFSCLFETECFETEPCRASDFDTTVDIEDSRVSTQFGDLEIVAAKRSETVIALFATGGETEFMMTVTPGAARLTAQINQGPQVVSYLGYCEGAF